MKPTRPFILNPFKSNPFTSLEEVRLVTAPPPVETHAPRIPLRRYLARAGGDLGDLGALLDLLGSGGKSMKKVEVIKRVPVAVAPEEDEP